ncbi:17.1 kDa class II heat shock protein [Pyrus x bretschneideri]|uniref:17.1 kDa class II heat shock protein n=1 Tax=Pyrus x bretschneideri TaxID=225117 RepID=UPI00202FC07A|nr:17.1 kDa class II heat shock protein [Pyrus x bretschneideri]
MEVMSLKNIGFDPNNLLETLHDLLDTSDEQNQQSHHAPSRQYLREAKAMAATPADVKETQNAYVFVVDVPGLRPDMIDVKIEDDNMLVVGGERRREKEKDQGVKYLRMERRLGKYLKKFVLPDNADIEKISAECQDGVLTIAVAKRPPPEPKKPKAIQVQISSGQGGRQGGVDVEGGGQGWQGGAQGKYGGQGSEQGGGQGGGQESQGGRQGGGQEWQAGRQGGGQGGQGDQGNAGAARRVVP